MVELPVVRRSQLFESRIEFSGVPLESPNRTLLRIYDMEAIINRRVRVTVEPVAAAFAPVIVELTLAPMARWLEFPPEPAYAELYLDQLYPHSVPGGSVVRIESLDPTLRFWAFITFTDYISHDVTTYSPR
ncbi:MAG: hypothetical protein NDJ92_13505 [Thermoanaerobaculia bacterium]|nr:hypothetical protein [Thermoanaerobaculia bacterium]